MATTGFPRDGLVSRSPTPYERGATAVRRAHSGSSVRVKGPINGAVLALASEPERQIGGRASGPAQTDRAPLETSTRSSTSPLPGATDVFIRCRRRRRNSALATTTNPPTTAMTLRTRGSFKWLAGAFGAAAPVARTGADEARTCTLIGAG